MKRRIFFAALLVIVAFAVGRQVNGPRAEVGSPARREIQRSFRLEPGARVEVRGINGPVEIKTAETDTAQVHVIINSDGSEEAANETFSVEHTPGLLVVRGEGKAGRFWRKLWGGGSARAQVFMTVPRRTEVAARGVNGNVSVGEIEGGFAASGVNGRVELERAAGRVSLKGVNGNVRLGLARVDADGMSLKGVNGNIEVRFDGAVDADLEVKGHHGRVSLEVPNVTEEVRERRSRMRARLGAGGPEISVKGVNGNVRFVSRPAPGAEEEAGIPTPPPAPPAPFAPPRP